MRVVLADPPAYTPFYDHDLASALGEAGADVELLTSRFRFGELPAARSYRRRELFYPLSTRLFRRSRLRIPVKALEHPHVLARLAAARADVVHVQWLSLPQVDARLLRLRSPSVFTAHDVLPRRTASRRDLWRRILRGFDAVVVHSANGRETLADLGVDRERLHVIPLAITPTTVERADDGKTLLLFGVIRPYKGIGDAVEVARRLEGVRLVVAGDPTMSLDAYRSAPGVDWRLGYLDDEQVRRALSEATVALFPYRPELDQSAALATALGAGVPAVCYDVGGIAEPVRRFGAGRVVPPGDVAAMTAAVRELLEDPVALASARSGAERARAELTWVSAARLHLDLYESLR